MVSYDIVSLFSNVSLEAEAQIWSPATFLGSDSDLNFREKTDPD